MMPGRRYSEGQHQALKAKEKVTIQPENQTLASITFQNYFRMYKKLAGMTGTAATEAEEFANIYGLNVVTVPTNVPIKRIDDDDAIFRTAEEKYDEITDVIVRPDYAETDLSSYNAGGVENLRFIRAEQFFADPDRGVGRRAQMP